MRWKGAVSSGRRRRWRRGAAAALAAVLVLPPLATELAPSPPAALVVVPVPPAAAYRVYVADWGYHTSVIVEQPPGWRLGPAGQEGARFVEYAWGERRFYMESDYRPHALFAALFLPTEAVAYVAAWEGAPEERARPRALYARTVGAAEWRALVRALEGTIHRAGGAAGADARARPFAPAAGYAGRFYPAAGRYLWWNDCNRWTVERLAAAGLARGGRGVIFSGQVAPRLVGFRPAPPA